MTTRACGAPPPALPRTHCPGGRGRERGRVRTLVQARVGARLRSGTSRAGGGHRVKFRSTVRPAWNVRGAIQTMKSPCTGLPSAVRRKMSDSSKMLVAWTKTLSAWRELVEHALGDLAGPDLVPRLVTAVVGRRHVAEDLAAQVGAPPVPGCGPQQLHERRVRGVAADLDAGVVETFVVGVGHAGREAARQRHRRRGVHALRRVVAQVPVGEGQPAAGRT